MQVSGYFYDSTSSTGVDGYVLTSKEDGPQWKMIEDVLSGVGGNGTATYIPQWIDSDTIGDSVMAQSGSAIGIGTDAPAYTLDVAGDIGVNQYIRHNGDPDTHINFTDDDINFKVGSVNFLDLTEDTVSEMTVNEGGANLDVRIEGDTDANLFFTDASTNRIGIGTATPAEKLDIWNAEDVNSHNKILNLYSKRGTNTPAGFGGKINLQLRNNAIDSPADAAYISWGVTNSANNDLRPKLVLGVGNAGSPSDRLTILNDGKVGIGITAPSAKLFITGDSTSRAFHVVSSSAGNATGYFYTNMVHTGTDTSATVSIRSDHASSTGQVLHVRGDGSGNLLTLDQGGTNRFVVRADGKVAIMTGTVTPLSSLHVNGDNTITVGPYGGNSTGYIVGTSSPSYTNQPGTSLILKAGDGSGTGSSYMAFYTSPSGSAGTTVNTSVERMRILNDGNVGIGYNSPTAPVHISRPTQTAGTQVDILNLYTNALNALDGEAWINIGSSSSTNLPGRPYVRIGANKRDSGADQATAMTFWTRENAVDEITERMRIDPAGNVGIGDNLIAPEHRLHVSGDAIISGVLYDSTNSSGVSGHVLTSEVGGPQWKMIEDVLSGVGGNGTANYIPIWEDEDTIGNSIIYQDGNDANIGIGNALPS